MEFDRLLRTAVVSKADDPLIEGLTIQSSYETSAEGAKAGGRGGTSWKQVRRSAGSLSKTSCFESVEFNGIIKLLIQIKNKKKNFRKARVGHKFIICKGRTCKKIFLGEKKMKRVVSVDGMSYLDSNEHQIINSWCEKLFLSLGFLFGFGRGMVKQLGLLKQCCALVRTP